MRDISADIKSILDGPPNYTIYRIVFKFTDATSKYKFDLDYLKAWCLLECKNKDWPSKYNPNKSRWMTYLSMKVKYCLLGLEEHIDDHRYNTTTISGIATLKFEGHDGMDVKYHSDFNTEEELYKKMLRDTYVEFLGEDLAALMLIGNMSNKTMAEKLGKEYTSFNKTLRRRMVKLKQALIDRELV